MPPEIQEHGFTFETWIRATFFDSHEASSYTGKWDIAKDANINYGGLPVSVKTAGYGSPVGFGDALRQFRIEEDFLLIVGFWKQEKEKKRIVNIVAAPITTLRWQSLWHPITFEDLSQLDAVIKNRTLTYQQARTEAQRIKSQLPFTQAHMTVNPKIDSKTQRRLQCTLGFSNLFSILAPEADQKALDKPKLFGVESIEAFLSSPRVFKKILQSEL
ncbi:hypothetical protein B1R32_10382 [Abditibacterium utsteinense]|uniref:Uncharacterized protein n=1 Tax=Abditibacterium utsteinense TaxID=1960156 RepID=A0A2S8SVI9_9BACT|nr:hypothetical protein [Abditibacterium utsteinense]PQV64815.1 hypothetical protein B1R32_10382 [Abditibacterium utsteinense]